MATRASAAAVLCAAAFLAVGSVGSAQDTNTKLPTPEAVNTPLNPSAPDYSAVLLPDVIVTGSNLPQAMDALAVPVAIIDSKVMDESGVNFDTLDILRKVSPNIGGTGEENAQNGGNGTYGGAGAAVNGLLSLVLVDGRRVVNDPAGAADGGQFVDLNLIPPSAIDHIEVLEDGASAIYGSDALGGVINIILKKNYNGWEAETHYGYSDNTGHYSEKSASLVGGVSNDSTSITIGLDYAQHDAIFLKDRSYSTPTYATYTYNGVIDIYDVASGNDDFYQLAPGVNAPPGGGAYTIGQLVSKGVYVPKTPNQVLDGFNASNNITLIGYLKRYSALANMEHRIFGSRLVAFSSVIVAHSDTWSEQDAQPNAPYVQDAYVDNDLYWGFTPAPPGTTIVPVNAPSNPFSQAFIDQSADGQSGEIITVRSRITQFPKPFKNDSDLFRVVGGLRGDIGENIHWEMAANLDRYDLSYTNSNLIDAAAFNAGIADGAINPFAITQAPGALTGVLGTAFVNMVSTLESYDAKVYGTFIDLPGGPLGFAIGGSYLCEGLSAVPDAGSLANSVGESQGWEYAYTFNSFSSERVVSSAFFELEIPITSTKQGIPGAHALSIDGAVRYDDYSGTVGATTNPQVSLSWAPIDDQLKVRASAGTSFEAPLLYTLYGPVSTSTLYPITYTVYNGNGAQQTGQFNGTSGSNPELKPFTAKTWSVGFVVAPKIFPGLLITADFVDLIARGFEGTLSPNLIVQSVESLGPQSPFAAYVHFDGPNGPTVTAPGGISSHTPQEIYVTGTLVNIGASPECLTDVKIDYTRSFGGIGKFEIDSAWTGIQRLTYQIDPSQPFYSYIGKVSQTVGTIPRWDSYTTIDWSKQGMDAFLGLTYTEGMTDVDVGGSDPSDFKHVGAYGQYDLGLSYDLSHLRGQRWLHGLKMTAGVNDLFNRTPPLAPDVYGITNAAIGGYGAIGRMFYINAKYNF
jgi:iron complex outermembrane recepter protein